MKDAFTKLSLLMLCVIMIVSVANAAEKGTLKAKVVDVEQGKVMSGVPVTITSPVMMGSKTSISNMDGEVLFVNLTPGLYTVKAELQGFKTIVLEKIRVSVSTEAVVHVEMVTAQIEETVTVTADIPGVDTTKAAIAEHVTADNVESLPVARDFVGYMQLAAGVNMVPNSQGRDTPQDPAGKGGLNYYDRGTQGTRGTGKRGSRDNLYLLDGMDITGLSSQTAQLAFNNEVIQEQELMTSGVPAEYGGGKGVVGNVVSKSGGNKLSGSLNIYAQPKSFFLPYGGSEYDAAKADRLAGGRRDETKLEGYEDNKYDTALTLGGPVMKDKVWFFLSGQYRDDKNKFNLSRSASATEEEVDFRDKRYSMFGKLTFKLSANDTVNFMYFIDDQDRVGERDKNIIKTQQRHRTWNTGVYSGYYQRVLSDKLLVDFRYGHYWWKFTQESRYQDAGTPDSVLYRPADRPPIYGYTFGGITATAADNKNTRDQFTFNLEWFPANMRIKLGAQYTLENDLDNTFYEFGEQRSSLGARYNGITFGTIYDEQIWGRSEFDQRLLPYLNAHWGPTSVAIDTNHDGVVSRDELRAVTFTSMNEHGLNFWRTMDSQVGANKVKAMRFAGFLMDDWKINEFFSLNAGVRIENHRYRNSEGGVILNMDTVFLPRLGLVWDIGAKGTQKLTAFYGHFSDPTPSDMIHFAGNISGSVRHEQIWLNNAWYTYRIRGSAEVRDAVWTPNTKDSLSREASLTHEIDLGKGLVMTTQAYMRQDRKIIEDYDLFTYVTNIDPNFTELALTYADFGYPPSGPPGIANYFLTNLIGGKRNIWGIDWEISKRFKNGSNLVFQYSYKWAEGNSQSDGNADLQGDFVELDPRNDWMMGPTPGTIPHKIKIFGTWRTKFGLDIGGMIYWNNGWKYTQSYVFMPGSYNIYYNWQNSPNPHDYVKTGQEMTPSYWQLDLKFNYTLKLTQRVMLDFFLDIYNVTGNQVPFDVQYGHNDPAWIYQEVTEILLPTRFYLGARIRF
jgi:hypothetical protein